MARQRYDIIFIRVAFFSEKFVFPHFWLFPLLHVRHCGYLVSDAHVWSAVVVEVDKAAYDLTGMFPGVELTLAIDTFFLDYAIDALCDGIVRGLVILGHGDGYAIRLEYGDIGVAAVLHTPV